MTDAHMTDAQMKAAMRKMTDEEVWHYAMMLWRESYRRVQRKQDTTLREPQPQPQPHRKR